MVGRDLSTWFLLYMVVVPIMFPWQIALGFGLTLQREATRHSVGQIGEKERLVQRQRVLLKPPNIRFSLKEPEPEALFTLVGDNTARLDRGVEIVSHHRTSEQGQANPLSIAVERKDVGHNHADGTPTTAHLGQVPQRQLASVVSTNQGSSHDAIRPLSRRRRQGQAQLEHLVLFRPKHAKQKFNVIRVSVKPPFSLQPTAPNPPTLRERGADRPPFK